MSYLLLMKVESFLCTFYPTVCIECLRFVLLSTSRFPWSDIIAVVLNIFAGVASRKYEWWTGYVRH